MPNDGVRRLPGGPGHHRDRVEDLIDQRVGVEDVERRSVGHGRDAYRGWGGDAKGCDPLRRNRRSAGVSRVPGRGSVRGPGSRPRAARPRTGELRGARATIFRGSSTMVAVRSGSPPARRLHRGASARPGPRAPKLRLRRDWVRWADWVRRRVRCPGSWRPSWASDPGPVPGGPAPGSHRAHEVTHAGGPGGSATRVRSAGAGSGSLGHRPTTRSPQGETDPRGRGRAWRVARARLG